MALETSTWLNLCFVEKILRKSEGDNSIQVIDIFSKPATNKGDNYTSEMVRVTAEFTRNQGNRKISEKKSIIVKIAPSNEGTLKDLVMKSGIFDTEMSMLTNTLDKMNKLLEPDVRLSARGLYVQKENPILLVMEDLAPLGFRMADRHAGLDLDHCMLAIQRIAKYHAASVALCEKEPNQKQLCAKGMFNPEQPPEMGGFFIMSTKALATEIATWPELDKKYSEKIAKMADRIYQIGVETCKCSEDEFKVISHGDFWVNNMLFKYNDDSKPIDHMFVDFQLCSYTSPAIDLHYFLNTSPSIDVIENNKALLLDEYLNTLSTTMKQLGCKTQPPTMEELKAILKKKASYGMIASFTVLPIVLCEKADLRGIDEIMGKDGSFQNTSIRGKQYRKLMTKRIPMFDEAGLLDL